MINLVFEVVVKVYGLVDDACNFFSGLVRVEGDEQGAVVDKPTDDIFDVFLDSSKVHIIKYLFFF